MLTIHFNLNKVIMIFIMIKWKFLSLLILVALLSCARVIDANNYKPLEGKTYAIIPFENYTDTPLAGYRVASIVEGVLRSKGYRVERLWTYKEMEPTKQELEEMMERAKEVADYVVYGTVNEYRYKTGIDGEPAVSISLFIIESSTGKVVFGSSLSASGWAHQSLGTLTQDLVRKVLR